MLPLATLWRIARRDLATRIRVFQRVLDSTGKGQSIDYYDKVVAPFVKHLADSGEIPAALQCLDRARRTLRVEPGRQLEQEMNETAALLRKH